MEEKFYTIQEIAKIFEVSRNNIYYYIKKNNQEYLDNKYIVYKDNVNGVKQVYITELGYNTYKKQKAVKTQINNNTAKEEVQSDIYKDKYIEFLETEVRSLKKERDSLLYEIRELEKKHTEELAEKDKARSEEVRNMLATFNNTISTTFKLLPSAEEREKSEKKESFISRIFGGTSR